MTTYEFTELVDGKFQYVDDDRTPILTIEFHDGWDEVSSDRKIEVIHSATCWIDQLATLKAKRNGRRFYWS